GKCPSGQPRTCTPKFRPAVTPHIGIRPPASTFSSHKKVGPSHVGQSAHLIVTPGSAKGGLKDPSAFLSPKLLVNLTTPTASVSSAHKPAGEGRETLQQPIETAVTSSTQLLESGNDSVLATATDECRTSSPSLSTQYEITARLVSSDDESDLDENEPAKKIPRWATG
ncbi:hypothetical protein TTRE_0000950201, partial [Trichuris trichiura]